MIRCLLFFFFFFFNDTATTEIYTLSLHDALPISAHDAALSDPLIQQDPCHSLRSAYTRSPRGDNGPSEIEDRPSQNADRKSTRLNSSHANISYAVFCLKKKKKTQIS